MKRHAPTWTLSAACAAALAAFGLAPQPGFIGRAHADRGAPSTWALPENDKGAGVVGIKVGVALPQAFQDQLSTSPFVEIEGGYLLPFVNRMFGIVGSFAFGMPTTRGLVRDARVPGGSYDYEQSTQQFQLGLTFLAKVPIARFVPYVGVGPRLFIVRTPSSGVAASGTAIPESIELSQEFGVGVPLGLDILLGPGRLFFELQLLYAASSQQSTGPGTFGSMTAAAGYRLVF
jgi:hypothetical protein